jgi:drug/metabolite transporter (DMT)-like permease
MSSAAETGPVPIAAPSSPVSAASAAGGTVLLWASAFPAITVADELGPVALSISRLLVASVALALVAPFMGVRRPRSQDLPLIALCGLAGMTAYQLLLNGGERVVPPGTASLLVATAPIYSALLAVLFLGERSSRRRWTGSAIAFAGSSVIAATHGLSFGGAALLVLGAAIVQAIYHTAQKPLLVRYTGFEVAVYAIWGGTLFSLPWAGSLAPALAHASGRALAATIFLGIAPSAIGFVLWAYATARMDVGRVTTSLYLVPVAAIAISFLWLGDRPGLVTIGGGAVALVGVVIANTAGRAPRLAAPDRRRRHPQLGRELLEGRQRGEHLAQRGGRQPLHAAGDDLRPGVTDPVLDLNALGRD